MPEQVGAARRVPRGAAAAGSLGGSSAMNKSWKVRTLWAGSRRVRGPSGLTPGEPGSCWWSLPPPWPVKLLGEGGPPRGQASATLLDTG